MRSIFLSALGALSVVLVAGCGNGDRGTRVSGTVTYAGAPVRAGRIYFNPDFTKQNTGPQGFAEIKEGRFKTQQGGRGAPTGPVVVRVEGFDGATEPGRPMGNAVFVYEGSEELPMKGTAAMDLAIEVDQATTAPKDEGPAP